MAAVGGAALNKLKKKILLFPSFAELNIFSSEDAPIIKIVIPVIGGRLSGDKGQ